MGLWLNVFDLLDLVLPNRCAGCGRAPRDRIVAPLCSSCRARLLQPPARHLPRPAPPGLPPPWAAAAYEGPVRATIVAYKERGNHRLRAPLAAALARSVEAAVADTRWPGPPLLLVPVPSRRATVARRGGDPVGRLVQATAATLATARIPVVFAPALRHLRGVADQAGLAASQRARNLAGALGVRPQWAAALRAACAVVADDVLTTGATLTEAARALRAAGARVPAAAVVAATSRHR